MLKRFNKRINIVQGMSNTETTVVLYGSHKQKNPNEFISFVGVEFMKQKLILKTSNSPHN